MLTIRSQSRPLLASPRPVARRAPSQTTTRPSCQRTRLNATLSRVPTRGTSSSCTKYGWVASSPGRSSVVRGRTFTVGVTSPSNTRGIAPVDPSPVPAGVVIAGRLGVCDEAAIQPQPRRHATGDRWFVDETYVKVSGQWVYLYRAIDQFGQVIDVLVSQKRDLAATRRFFARALEHGPRPSEVSTDQAPAYPRVVDELLPAACHVTEQYANNPIESDHGRLKSRLWPMRGLKRLRSIRVISAGHAFVQNLRCGHYELGLDIDPRHRLPALLKLHKAEQERERLTAAQLRQETGYVFTTPTGGPLNPRTDYTEWKRLLERAGVPERRLHDVRHTAATVLLLLQIPDRTVMAIMGWSNTAMAARYQHIIAAIRRDVANSVGGLLWKPTEPPVPDTGDGATDNPAPAA